MKKKLMACMALMIPVLTFTGCSSDMGAKLAKAGMNTLMGMGTVFVVLIFIAFVISRFKYIAQFENWMKNRKNKKAEAQAPASVEVSEAENTQEESEETDDLELVAVITAALAASLETSPDKLVVRSIRRKNTNRW